jgi:hypothetical protein
MAMPSGSAPTACRRIALACAASAVLLASTPVGAQSNNVRITQLSDVAFGTPASLSVDATAAQSICVFAQTAGRGYQVTASGSAPGGVFALTSGAALLDYEVQWSSAAGQSSGTQLSPNVTLGGLVSSATQQSCNSGPPTSASLILLLRSTALSSARAGAYAGTLTLLIGPE